MCFFCCVTLRGVTYFLVTIHMVGMASLSMIGIGLFTYPPTYPDINLSPFIMSQLPLIVAAYSLLSLFFSCFIFRAVDMDSISQLKWSGLGFGVYQILVLVVQLLFSIMFGDILNKGAQLVFAAILLLSFFVTCVYLSILSLYGRSLYRVKYGKPKAYRNALQLENNNNNNNSMSRSPTTNPSSTPQIWRLLASNSQNSSSLVPPAFYFKQPNTPNPVNVLGHQHRLSNTSTTGTNTDHSPPPTGGTNGATNYSCTNPQAFASLETPRQQNSNPYCEGHHHHHHRRPPPNHNHHHSSGGGGQDVAEL